MRFSSLLIPALFVLAGAARSTPLPGAPPAAPAVRAKISADRVNLRAAADTNAEVVVQVDYDTQLEVLEVSPEWVKVRPPEAVLFWVHGDLVKEGRVARKVINVRAGSSENYSIVGQLERNAEVQVVTNRLGWLGIRPPAGTGLWVFHEYVELPPPPPPPEVVPAPVVVVEPPAPPPPPPPVVAAKEPVEPPVVVEPPPPPPPPPPADLKLVPLAGQGTLSTRTGVLRAYLLTAGKPSRFRLTLQESAGIEQAVCMVKGDEDVIRPWIGRKVILRGRDYWVQGEKLPVTVPEDIQAAGN
jgi:SH3-like domain-containing protein